MTALSILWESNRSCRSLLHSCNPASLHFLSIKPFRPDRREDLISLKLSVRLQRIKVSAVPTQQSQEDSVLEQGAQDRDDTALQGQVTAGVELLARKEKALQDDDAEVDYHNTEPRPGAPGGTRFDTAEDWDTRFAVVAGSQLISAGVWSTFAPHQCLAGSSRFEPPAHEFRSLRLQSSGEPRLEVMRSGQTWL